MISEYQGIKGQRVSRRPEFNVHGNTVLQSPQKPVAKRPARTVYGNVAVKRYPEAARPYVDPPPPVTTVTRPETPSLDTAPLLTFIPKNEPLPPYAGFWARNWKRVLIGAFLAAAAGIFAYNALLWQGGEFIIKNAEDITLRNRMLDYAAAGADALQAPQAQSNSEPVPEQASLMPSEPFTWMYYTAKKGDSVSKIAADHSLSMDAVIASNKLSNARNIKEGDVLRMPNMDGIPYTLAAGDNYEAVAAKFGVPFDALLDANDIQTGTITPGEQIFIPGAKMPAEELKQALGELFIYPVRGRISSSFGWRKDPFSGVRTFHKGIDIVVNVGTPVKASMAGKIAMIGFSPILGRYVIISHGNGYQTMYAHLNSTQVARGEKVIQGGIIGEAGNTGYSTGPHLHFVIYKNGREINPLEHLKV